MRNFLYSCWDNTALVALLWRFVYAYGDSGKWNLVETKSVNLSAETFPDSGDKNYQRVYM